MACLPTYNNKRYSSIQELINALSLEETARAYREAVTASGALVPRLDEFSSVHEWVDYYNEHASQGSYARIAFLGLDYVESVSTTGVVTRTTTTPIISDSAQEFLRHKKFKPGTALTAKVNDNDDTLIYDPTASDNSQITWGKLKEMLAEGNLETKSGIPLTKDDLVPIDLYLGEDKIPGNVHTLAWVDKNAKNTDKEGNDIKQHELNEIERVRQLIIGGNTDLVITNYDFGMFNTGDVKQLPTDLETVIIKNGEVMVGSVAKELITPDVVDGITYAVTDQGLVPVERDRLSEVEKDSVVNFINAVFNPQSNSTLITALASKGIDVRDMVQVERFISTFVKTERPVTPANFNTVMQEHANRLYDYRVKTGKDLPPYTGIEVNKEGTDFSLLIGRTNAGKNTYTTYKITKVKGKTEVHIFKRDDNDVYKYVNSGIDPSTFIKNTLRNLLINRKVNHTDAKAIHLIEDGAINTVDYTNYMKGRLLSNINFNKTATGYTAYFQPQITFDFPRIEQKTEVDEREESFDEFSPDVYPNAGEYLREFVVPNEQVKIVNELASAILGPVYEDLLKRNLPLSEYEQLVNHYSNLHILALQESLNNPKTNEAGRIRIKNLLDNWNVVLKVAATKFKEQVKALADEVDTDNESEVRAWDDDKYLSQDVFDESSDRIKMFFAFIPIDISEKSVFNKGKANSALFKNYYDSKDVWNKINEVLALRYNRYIEPRWSDMETLIRNSKLDFALEFVTRANALQEYQRNELVGLLYNSSRDFKMLLDEGISKKEISVSVEGNSNVRIDQWVNNLTSTPNVDTIEVEVDSRLYIEHVLTERYYSNIEELKTFYITPGSKNGEDLLRDPRDYYARFKVVLDDLGIELYPKTWSRFINNEWGSNPFSKSKGSMLFSLLRTLDQKNPSNLNRLMSDNMFTTLAAFDMVSSENLSSSKAFSGDKVIQVVGPIRNYELRMSKFITGGLQKLKDYAFSSLAAWNKVFHVMEYGSIPPEAMRQKSKGTGNLGYEDFTKREHSIFRLANYDLASSKDRVERAKFITGPMEDKKNPFSVIAPKFEFGEHNRMHSSTDITKLDNDNDIYDFLIAQLVVPDILRMNDVSNIKGYYPKNFYLVPILNKIPELQNPDILLDDVMRKALASEGLMNVKSWFQKKKIDYYDIIRNKLIEIVDKTTKQQTLEWNRLGILGKKGHLPPSLQALEENQRGLGIKNYVVNYMIFNANEHIITGDPALYAKGKPFEFSYKNVISALDNKQKRLAAYNASYKHVANPGKMNVLVVDDPSIFSNTWEFLTKWIDYESTKYKAKEASDAQMFTSWESYLSTLHRLGQLNDADYAELSATFERQSEDIRTNGRVQKSNLISYSKLENLLHPLKTVISTMEDEKGVRERAIYIKMSEMPLIPQITQGFEIDKLRRLLEDTRTEAGKLDKIAFSTAFKVGSPKPIKLNVENNSLLSVPSEVEGSYYTIDEIGYGEQTANPQDTSYQVIHGSQQAKLKFLNIMDEDFFYDNNDGEGLKKRKGKELKKIRDSKYEELFKIKYDQLVAELAPNGELNYAKVQEILASELREFDPTYAYSLEESTIKDKIPLWENPLFKRIQPRLISIVESRISKTKVHGKSYVQAFSDFFRTKDISKTNIITTSSFDGELKSIRDENGVIVAGQIMIPWKWKADISRFVKDGKINFEQLPKELLESTAFRIPTSGHNSITRLEIVGFLPKFMGNTILVPSDLMVQMGSDLDFDKLYSLFYNTTLVENVFKPTIVDSRSIDENVETAEDLIDSMFAQLGVEPKKEKKSKREKDLENDLLDIDKAIYLSDSPILRRENHNPISYGLLSNSEGTGLADVKKKQLGDVNPLAPDYQIDKYLAGRTGKGGVGSFSIDVVFHAALQGTGIKYVLRKNQANLWHLFPDGKEYKTLTMNGIKYEDVKVVELDRMYAKPRDGKQRFISDIYSAYQQAMLDNGKEQMSDVLNITNDTFNFIRGMIQTGNDEIDIHKVLEHPLIEKLISRVKQHSGYYSQYRTQDDLLEEMIKSNPGETVLLKYKAFYELGKSLSSIRAVLNIDSKGFDGSGWGPILKSDQMRQMSMNNKFINLEKLRRYEDDSMTFLYAASYYSIEGSKIFYGERTIPYKLPAVKSAIDQVMSYIPEGLQSSSSKKVELREKIFDEWLKYHYSSFRHILNVPDLKELRLDMLYRDPLGAKLLKIKDSKDLRVKHNALIRNLEVDIVSGFTYVKIANNQLGSVTPQDLQTSLIELNDRNYELYDGYTGRQFVADLYKYAYLVAQKQGPNEFMKYLPLDYIYENPLAKVITDRSLKTSTYISSWEVDEMDSFLIQFFQHNPAYASQFDANDFNIDEDSMVKKDPEQSYPAVLLEESEDLETGYSIKTLWISVDGSTYAKRDILGNYLHSEYDNGVTTVQTSLLNVRNAEIENKETELDVRKVISDTIDFGRSIGELEYKFLNKLLEVVPKVKLIESRKIQYKGKYVHKGEKTIFIRDWMDSTTLTHELIHAVTKQLTDWYYTDNSQLTPEQIKIISDIDAIYHEIFNDQNQEFKDVVAALNKRKEDGEMSKGLSPEERIPYAMSSLQEFMAHLTDYEFRDWLQQKYDNKELNWYQKLREFLKRLLNTIIGDRSVVDVIEKRVFDLFETLTPERAPVDDALLERLQAYSGQYTISDTISEYVHSSGEREFTIDGDHFYVTPKGTYEINGESVSANQFFERGFNDYLDRVNKNKGQQATESTSKAPKKSRDHKMYYKMPANANLTGENTTTLDLIEQGLRTGTTRSFPLGKVGDIITFEGRPQEYEITQVERLTEDNIKDPAWIKQWSQKEQWTEEYFINNVGKTNTVKVGSYQTTFKKVQDDEFLPLDYKLDAVDTISNNLDKIKEWSKKAANLNELINKIRNDLKIPKDQIELLRNSEGNTIEDKLVDFASKYTYIVDVSTATMEGRNIGSYNQEDNQFEPDDPDDFNQIPSQHYSNMTVPGGTNYREVEISTPNITPSIKGHAQFATSNGIGWFRSDESQQYQETDIQNIIDNLQKSGQLEINCK